MIGAESIDLKTESDVEQKLIFPLLSAPNMLAIPIEAIKTKDYLSPTTLDKDAGRRGGRYYERPKDAVGSQDTLDLGRVENRLAPALPHQTVHAVFPHTAFRCSSYRGMRLAPARCCRNLV